MAAAMAQPALHRWLDTLRVLARMGGRPPRGAVGGSVELLQGEDFAFMVGIGIEIGAPNERYGPEGELRLACRSARWRSRRTRATRPASIASSR